MLTYVGVLLTISVQFSVLSVSTYENNSQRVKDESLIVLIANIFCTQNNSSKFADTLNSREKKDIKIILKTTKNTFTFLTGQTEYYNKSHKFCQKLFRIKNAPTSLLQTLL